MKTIIRFIAVLGAVLLSQCLLTNLSDVSISELRATGRYESANDLTSFEITVSVTNNNILTGSISQWQFLLIENDTAFRSFNDENYRWYLCEDQSCRNVALTEEGRRVVLSVVVAGDLFEGRTPQEIVATIGIQDEESGESVDYYINETAVFDFSRE